MNKILILMFDIGRYINGAISVYISFSNMLSNNGYDVCIGCPYKNSKKPEQLNDNIKFINSDIDFKGNNDNWGNEFVEKFKPELIVIFFPFLYPKLLSKYDNIPRILMFHSYPLAQLPPNITINPENNNFVNTCVQILQLSFYDCLPYYIKKEPVVIIPNAIEQYNTQKDYNKEHKRIVFLSRVDKGKGIHRLIKAFAIVLEKYPNWSLDIYGQEANSKYSVSLRKLVYYKKLTKKVSFKGVVENKKEVLQYYDFCVFPSASEAFSIGLGECMSAGLPCIGFETSFGVNEMIINNFNGILCKNDIKVLADKMIYLIENLEIRKRLGEGAKKYISKFSHERVDKLWIELIDTILTKGINSLPLVKCY